MEDIVEWDVGNWWRAIRFWEEKLGTSDLKGKKVLDIGGRSGGLSLYWALKGASVVCSDINDDGFEKARELHRKYGEEDKVRYEVIDATDIPYEEFFDIICFKSVLGGVGYNDNFAAQKKMMGSIHRALKKNGQVFFAENLAASPFHQFTRRWLRKWGGHWRYIQISEMGVLTEEFSEAEYRTIGFLGIFGRVKGLSGVLNFLDKKFDQYVNDADKYIVSCILRK